MSSASGGVVTVTTTPTRICTTRGGVPAKLVVSGDTTVFLGGPSVTATTGFPLASGNGVIDTPTNPGSPADLLWEVWGVVSSGTGTISWLAAT